MYSWYKKQIISSLEENWIEKFDFHLSNVLKLAFNEISVIEEKYEKNSNFFKAKYKLEYEGSIYNVYLRIKYNYIYGVEGYQLHITLKHGNENKADKFISSSEESRPKEVTPYNIIKKISGSIKEHYNNLYYNNIKEDNTEEDELV